MGIITLENVRATSDITVKVRLKDGGVYIDWSTLTDIKAYIFSDAQRAMAGRCAVDVDENDGTLLVCEYSANKPQYLGVNRIVVQGKYRGRMKTYDKAAFNVVSRTHDSAGDVVLDDPVVDLDLEVADVSSSILDTAILAAIGAADRANEAAEAAEHMVDIHEGPQGPVGETPDISIGTVTTAEPGTPAAATMTGTPEAPVLNLTIPKGVAGDTPAFTVGEVTTGQPGTPVVVTITGTAAAPVLNITIPQGLQGNTGSSVDYPYELVNNLITNDATKGLSAAQGKVLKDELTQLEADVNGYDVEALSPQSLTADKFFNTNVATMANSPSNETGCYCAKLSVTPGQVYRIYGEHSSGTSYRLWATADSSRARLRRELTGAGQRVSVDVTIQSGEAYLYVNLYDYDSNQDGLWLVTTQHTNGLVDDVQDLDERVTAIEQTPAVGVIDSLGSTSTTDALSANQGRVLNEDINGTTTPTYTDQPLQADKYFNTETSRIPIVANLSDLEGTYCCRLAVTPGQVYRIYGKGNSGNIQLYALGYADRYVVEGGTPGVALNTRTTPLDLTIPEGVAVLAVNLYQYDSTTDKVQLVGSTTSECVKTRLSALEAKDVEIESYALPLKGKKVMFFGDSITEFTYGGKGSVAYFADYSGADCYKAAVGGTRFVQRMTPVDNPTTDNQAYAALDICNMVKAWCEADYTKQDAACAFLNDYTARVNALKNNPVNTIDIVVIGGGTNDITNGSPIGTKADDGFTTLWGVFNKMVKLLLTANPALKIYFYSPVVGYRNNNRTDADWSDNYEYADGTRPEYVDLFTVMAKHSHIPYIDVYNTLGWNQTNFSHYFIDTDGTHPYKGFDVIARRLYGQIKALME